MIVIIISVWTDIISTIVKNLGIAKGSIYQYFEDKADLYAFLVETSMARRNEILRFVAERSNGPLSLWLLQLCLAELKFVNEFPEMQLLLEKAHVEKGYTVNKEYDGLLKERLSALTFSSEVVDQMVFIISNVNMALIQKYKGHSLTDALINEHINPLIMHITKIMTDQS